MVIEGMIEKGSDWGRGMGTEGALLQGHMKPSKRKKLSMIRPRGYKTFLCSTKLSTNFQLLIKTKKPTNSLSDVVFIMLVF